MPAGSTHGDTAQCGGEGVPHFGQTARVSKTECVTVLKVLSTMNAAQSHFHSHSLKICALCLTV